MVSGWERVGMFIMRHLMVFAFVLLFPFFVCRSCQIGLTLFLLLLMSLSLLMLLVVIFFYRASLTEAEIRKIKILKEREREKYIGKR